MFLCIAAKKGKKTAFVGARKMLTVVWHLFVNGEKYVEKVSQKQLLRRISYKGHLPIETMVEVLRTAGYTDNS